ncbi:MAG TPA: hypothetical protein PLV92_09125 [Pirellulaceae bacterium]|nr:hypothetical protein [Pirellulaceae bacterium]
MEFVSQTARRVSARWSDAAPWARGLWTLAALLAVGAAIVGYRWTSGDETEFLFAGREFSPSELATMEAALGRARLTGARVVGSRLEIPRQRKDAYLKALQDQGALPAEFFSHVERLIAQDNPFTSQRQRDALSKLAQSRETALMVRKMAGIEDSSVQFDDYEVGGFPRRKERRATVAVRATAERTLDDALVHAIRHSVQSAIGADEVTVLDLNAARAYAGSELPIGAVPTGRAYDDRSQGGAGRSRIAKNSSPRSEAVGGGERNSTSSTRQTRRGDERGDGERATADRLGADRLGAERRKDDGAESTSARLVSRVGLAAGSNDDAAVNKADGSERQGSAQVEAPSSAERGSDAGKLLEDADRRDSDGARDSDSSVASALSSSTSNRGGAKAFGSSQGGQAGSTIPRGWWEVVDWRDQAPTIVGVVAGLLLMGWLGRALGRLRRDARRTAFEASSLGVATSASSTSAESSGRVPVVDRADGSASGSERAAHRAADSSAASGRGGRDDRRQELTDMIQGDPQAAAAAVRQWLGNAA